MSKRYMLCGVLLFCLHAAHAGAVFINSNTITFQQVLDNFSKVDKNNLPGIPVNEATLPKPYDYLLTQNLMTPGIENYYQRTPIVQTIHAVRDRKNNTYSRIIVMLIDKDLARNNAEIAQEKNQEVLVETAVVTMNFAELPEKVVSGVLTSKIPFGKLLVDNQVAIVNKDRAYFSIRCNKPLSALTHCTLNTRIYGRVNTIMRADTKQWLARIVEILPGVVREDIG
jgi:hypothetical protein